MKKHKPIKIKRQPKDTDRLTQQEEGTTTRIRLEVEGGKELTKKGGSFKWTSGETILIENTGSVVLSYKTGKYSRKIPVSVVYGSYHSMMLDHLRPLGHQANRIFHQEGKPPIIVSICWTDTISNGSLTILSEVITGQIVYVIMDVEGLDNEEQQYESEILFDGKRLSYYRKMNNYKISSTKTLGNKDTFYFVLFFEESILDNIQKDSVELEFTLPKKIKSENNDKINNKINLVRKNKLAYKGERINTAQIAAVGSLDIIENNHKPCKYTKIIVKPKKFEHITHAIEIDEGGNEVIVSKQEALPDVVVFDETKSTEIKTMSLIGGNNMKTIEIELAEITERKCNLGKLKSHSIKREFIFNGNETQRLKLNGNKLTAKVNYNYSTLGYLFAPLACIWPLWKKNTYTMQIESCRHNKQMIINVYPDVQWFLGFNFKMSFDSKKKVTWAIALVFESKWDLSEQKKTMSESVFSEPNYLSSEKVSLDINCINKKESHVFKIDGSKKGVEVLKKYVEQSLIRKVLAICKTAVFMYEIVENLASSVDLALQIIEDPSEVLQLTGKVVEGKKYDVPAKRKRYEFKPLFPDFEIGLNWRASSHNGNSGILVIGGAKGRVIGGTFIFDVFAIASSVKQIRAFVLVMDMIAKYIFRAEVEFNIKLSGDIMLDARMAYDSAKGETDGRLQTRGQFKIMLELYVSSEEAKTDKITTKRKGKRYDYKTTEEVNTNSGIEHGVRGEASFIVKMDIEPDKDGVWAVFNALSGVLKAEVYTKLDGFDKCKAKTTRKDNRSRHNGLKKKTEQKKNDDAEKKEMSKNDKKYTNKDDSERIIFQRILLEEGYWKMFNNDKELRINLISQNDKL